MASREPGKEGDRAGADGPGNRADHVSDMQVLLSEERMDFQHVFEDSAPGMPWARVSFQVSSCSGPAQDTMALCSTY